MSAISSTLTSSERHLRSFDTRRDLKPAADLIELCFAETLTIDGRRYLQNMRAAAERSSGAYWGTFAATRASLPLAGYVWEDGGQLVANLSLVPFIYQGRRIYLIANVAVHPDYRRQGIARALTKVALDKAKRRRVQDVWLHAREDNPAALTLYASMGFQEQTRRSTWNISPKCLEGETPAGCRVTIRLGRYWNQQRKWLLQSYPEQLRWYLPMKISALRPDLWGFLYRFFSEINIRHWVAQCNDRLLGILTWQGSQSYADHLWLAAHPQNEELALQTILPFLRRERRIHRPLTLDYPVGRAAQTLHDAGFEFQHTLIWMKIRP